eukprot:CAMPEP_0197037618 /NCGR_PEP_ID=MMETSP1384-20130603/14774_1 /TAXON_ID=29189 /ORGANISM="Ammonia sp." /LENGTH=93 /DNA_ID=CAMNT_0042467939 /DNA_START=24 /DNA_END=301 /DNA_ORIENTATION=+
MSFNGVRMDELARKLEHQLSAVEKLEQELQDVTNGTCFNWRTAMKHYLLNIRDHIEDLGNRQTELENNRTLLQHSIFKLESEIDELTTTRRKL